MATEWNYRYNVILLAQVFWISYTNNEYMQSVSAVWVKKAPSVVSSSTSKKNKSKLALRNSSSLCKQLISYVNSDGIIFFIHTVWYIQWYFSQECPLWYIFHGLIMSDWPILSLLCVASPHKSYGKCFSTFLLVLFPNRTFSIQAFLSYVHLIMPIFSQIQWQNKSVSVYFKWSDIFSIWLVLELKKTKLIKRHFDSTPRNTVKPGISFKVYVNNQNPGLISNF